MTNIHKRSGKMETYDKKKLEKSMRNAGASEKTASSIADGLKPTEGPATAEIRRTVAAELKHNDPGLSKRYAEFNETPVMSIPTAQGRL